MVCLDFSTNTGLATDLYSSELSAGSVAIDFTGSFGRKIDDFNSHKHTIEDILWSHSLKNVDQSKPNYLSFTGSLLTLCSGRYYYHS